MMDFKEGIKKFNLMVAYERINEQICSAIKREILEDHDLRVKAWINDEDDEFETLYLLHGDGQTNILGKFRMPSSDFEIQLQDIEIEIWCRKVKEWHAQIPN